MSTQIIVIIALLSVGLAYVAGKAEGDKQGFNRAANECLNQKQQAVARAIEQTNQINQQNNDIAQAAFEQALAKKPKIQVIEKEIVKYAQQHTKNHGADYCQLDDSELHILQNLTRLINGTANGNAATSTHPTVPTAANANGKKQTATPKLESTSH